MKLLHGNDMPFVRCPDGRVYSPGIAVYAWWKEYLRVFDEVIVAARVYAVKEMYPADRLAEGPGVSFHDLPHFRGSRLLLFRATAVESALDAAIAKADAFVFRVPGAIGSLGARRLIRQGRPYGYEVGGDPRDGFSPSSVAHPLRFYLQNRHARNLRRFCASACAASYATENGLQKHFPPPSFGFATHYADVALKPDVFVGESRAIQAKKYAQKLLFVGTLEELSEAPDILVKAVAKCRRQGLNVHLTIVGDGGMRGRLESLAAELDVREAVHFAGHVAGRDGLAKMLDQSDLFVLPSRTEGLPHSMLEAMARAVPCVGSTVKGISQLLDAEDVVPPNNVSALASRIGEVLSTPARLSRMSARVLNKAHEFELEPIRARKLAFLQHVRDASEQKRVIVESRQALRV